MYFIEHITDDIEIIKNEVIQENLDIEVVTKDDPDYQILLRGREERITHPENYLSEDDIDWD
jgi:hypothetical protein